MVKYEYSKQTKKFYDQIIAFFCDTLREKEKNEKD